MLKHSSCSGIAARFTCGLALFAAGTPAHAITTWCVGDATQFSQALTAASASSDNLLVIKLRQGTYDAFAASYPFSFLATHSNQVVEISGGWDGAGGTCQSNVVDPTLTRIIGTTAYAALSISTGMSNGTSGNQLYLHDVSISNPYFTASSVSGACLKGSVNAGNELRVDRVHLHDCVAVNSAFAAAFLSNTGGVLSVRNVAAWNSLALHSGGIAVTTGNGGTSRLAQVSVTNAKSIVGDATSNAGLLVSTSDASSTTTVSNSVSWGNSGYLDPFGQPTSASDIFLSGTGISLTRVHRGSSHGSAASDIGAGDGDPGFVTGTDPHLRSDSLLIDSGVADPDGGTGVFDADGGARVRGAAVDVGAFEADPDTILASGFE